MASGEQIERGAADWLARLDRAHTSAAMQAEFLAWCGADSRHLTSYLRLLGVWNRLDGLRPCSVGNESVGNELCS